MMPLSLRRLAGALAAVALGTSAAAQSLPSEPITLAGGRVVVSGEASVGIAARDPAYFNYTDYDHNALRLLRLSVSGEVRANDRLWFLGEVVDEVSLFADPLSANPNVLRAYAWYARVRPWRQRAFDIQVGRIPPTFGSFMRRSYGGGNPLIGYPLAYQYLTSLRPNALPATVDELLNMRTRGWQTRYRVGSSAAQPGLPLVSGWRWDMGVQMRVAWRALEAAGAVTNGTISNPRVRDDNGGKQLVGRLALRPSPAVVVGISGATGAYLSRDLRNQVPGTGVNRSRQRALGVDADFSRDYWQVRAEAILSSWDLPLVRAPQFTDPLKALAVSLETRYRVLPAVYVASRVEHLTFSRVTGTLFGGQPTPWEAPVSRVEVGGGYYLQRNLVAKVVYQHNWRAAGRVRARGFTAAQLLYWF